MMKVNGVEQPYQMLTGACALSEPQASCEKCGSQVFELAFCKDDRITLTCVCGHVQKDKSKHAIGQRVNTKKIKAERGPLARLMR